MLARRLVRAYSTEAPPPARPRRSGPRIASISGLDIPNFLPKTEPKQNGLADRLQRPREDRQASAFQETVDSIAKQRDPRERSLQRELTREQEYFNTKATRAERNVPREESTLKNRQFEGTNVDLPDSAPRRPRAPRAGRTGAAGAGRGGATSAGRTGGAGRTGARAPRREAASKSVEVEKKQALPDIEQAQALLEEEHPEWFDFDEKDLESSIEDPKGKFVPEPGVNYEVYDGVYCPPEEKSQLAPWGGSLKNFVIATRREMDEEFQRLREYQKENGLSGAGEFCNPEAAFSDLDQLFSGIPKHSLGLAPVTKPLTATKVHPVFADPVSNRYSESLAAEKKTQDADNQILTQYARASKKYVSSPIDAHLPNSPIKIKPTPKILASIKKDMGMRKAVRALDIQIAREELGGDYSRYTFNRPGAVIANPAEALNDPAKAREQAIKTGKRLLGHRPEATVPERVRWADKMQTIIPMSESKPKQVSDKSS